MKHILPVLTVTALAAAASAQTAPAPAAKQSLSYNRIVVSHVSNNATASDTGVSFFAQAKIGGGLYVSAITSDLQETTADTSASVGYAYSLPSIIGVASDLNVEVGYKSLGVGIRALIGGGVELGVAHVHEFGGDGDDSLSVTASYNLGFLAKGLSVNAGYTTVTGTTGLDTTSIGLGFNF